MSRRIHSQPSLTMRDDSRSSDLADSVPSDLYVVCSPAEDRCRQEFKDDADVNLILRRHGVGAASMLRPVAYGSYDFDQSLHGALLSLQSFREAFSGLPEGLRKAYPSPEALMAAVAAGEDIQAALDAEILSASGGASASDSAPVPPADPSAAHISPT